VAERAPDGIALDVTPFVIITITRKAGSFTMEESLTRLVQEGLIERKEALVRAAYPDELDSILGPG
jgi:Tfp pilus assembly pilus retraction ATPase PilT